MEDTGYKHVPLETAKRLECRDVGRADADAALIKQLGEALELSALVVRHERDLLDHECGKFDDAITAFNNWKRERGE